MLKNFTLLSISLIVSYVCANAQYTTPGDKTCYNFSKLSQIAESGVTANGNVYTVNNDINISATDTLTIDNNAEVRFANGVTITIDGDMIFAPADTAYVTSTDIDALPYGFKVMGDNSRCEVKSVNFEYVGIRFAGDKGLRINGCTFSNMNGKLTTTGTVSFLGNSYDNIIENSAFIENSVPAVGGAANFSNGLIFRNNYLYDNNTSNTNKPQINLTSGGEYDIEIIGNTIEGTGRNMVGGIGVSNMMSLPGANNIYIKDNEIRDNRYGITLICAMNGVICNNQIISNKYETNANNGGSGISLYDPYLKQTARVLGNTIEDNLWGITVIGCGNVYLGKTDDPTENDEPGMNVFKDNGNNGTLYDLYNNSTNTIYAQGNTWNVAEQDSVSIETVIFHKNDNASLGEVIFMPRSQSAISSVANNSNRIYYNATEQKLVLSEPAEITIYNADGRIAAHSAASNCVNVSTLAKGIYIARQPNGKSYKFIK